MAADTFLIQLSTTIENIDVNVALVSAQSTVIEYSFPQGPQGPPGLSGAPGAPGVNTWGSLSGVLSAQTDLWTYLSAEPFSVPQLTAYLNTNALSLCSVDVKGQILSAGINLSDIFLTSETDSQTLSYNVTGENLSISSGNTVNLSALSYRNIEDPTSMLQTIEQFANSYSGSIHPGYNVTLYNGRVYTFAGTDKNNPSHYLEVNANPYLPIYREVALSGDQTEVIDSYYLGDFKTAKYNLQIETNFNNEIYYSEINVVGSVLTSTGVASEYGQISTDQLILGYDVNISFNNLEFIMLYSADMTPGRKLIVKGHRTNFYKI
jgi:hypothetical protein